MKLTKSQISNIIHFWEVMLLCFGGILFMFKCVPKSTPEGISPVGTTTLENADSLEIANPADLENYFAKW